MWLVVHVDIKAKKPSSCFFFMAQTLKQKSASDIQKIEIQFVSWSLLLFIRQKLLNIYIAKKAKVSRVLASCCLLVVWGIILHQLFKGDRFEEIMLKQYSIYVTFGYSLSMSAFLSAFCLDVICQVGTFPTTREGGAGRGRGYADEEPLTE